MFRHEKGTLYSKNGVAVVYLHEGFPVSAGVKTQCTIQHVSCEMLVSNGQCPVCERYNCTLPSTYSYFIKKTHPSLTLSRLNYGDKKCPILMNIPLKIITCLDLQIGIGTL